VLILVLLKEWLEPRVEDVSPIPGASGPKPSVLRPKCWGVGAPYRVACSPAPLDLHALGLETQIGPDESTPMMVDEVSPSTEPRIDPIGDDVNEEDVDNPIPQVPVLAHYHPHHLATYLRALKEFVPDDEERLKHLVTASISDVAFNLMCHQAIEA
jgi:hypothetical protein